jgi:integrase
MKKNNRDNIFRPQEWIDFVNSIKQPDKKIRYELQLNTGARFNEMCNIKVRDIDFNGGTIFLRVTKRRTNYSDGSPRLLPVSSAFLSKLFKFIKEKGLSEEDYLFKLSQVGYNNLIKKKLKRLGIKDSDSFSSHNIRKTLETWLACLDIGTLKILRHFGHFQSTALKYYVQMDYFSIEEKILIREIIGDLYLNNSQEGHILNKRVDLLQEKIKELTKELRKQNETTN